MRPPKTLSGIPLSSSYILEGGRAGAMLCERTMHL